MYSSVSWIPKGKASTLPILAAPTQAEIDASNQEQAMIDENERMLNELANKTDSTTENNTEDLDMNIEENLNEETMEDENGSDFEEDYKIEDHDCILLAAKSDEEQSSLEVHVYDSESGNFFLHHDIILPAFPLSMAWLECAPEQSEDNSLIPGSYVAVGTFQPGIEIWDCDVMDVIEPECVLGGLVEDKRRTLKPSSHTLAVMGLSANPIYKNILASSSADKTVKLWDIPTQKCMITMKEHKDKVQGVSFHPYEASILATCSYDHTACVFDCRCASYGSVYKLYADPECLDWDPFSPYSLYIAQEDGTMISYDIRNVESPLCKQKLHTHDCSSLQCNRSYKGLVATCGDNLIRLWDVRTPQQWKMVAEKKTEIDTLFGVSWYPSQPTILGAGGNNEQLCIWDIQEDTSVSNDFEFANNVAPEDLSFSVSSTATGDMNDLHETPKASKKSKKGKKH